MSTDVIGGGPATGGQATRAEARFSDTTLAGVTSPLALVAVAAVLAAVVQAVMALDLPGPWIVPDELIYSELAKSIGSGALPAVRGEVTWGYGILYPLLISPAWAVFDDPSRAYVAAKVINSVLLGVTAFPAYFLARKFVETRAAVAVAAFSVFVPSMLYSGTLLTEVALYPVFVLALLGIASAIRRPTRRNQLLAVGAVALACSAKPLSIILAGVYVLAVVHLAVLDRRAGGAFGTRVRAHATALGTFGGLGGSRDRGSHGSRRESGRGARGVRSRARERGRLEHARVVRPTPGRSRPVRRPRAVRRDAGPPRSLAGGEGRPRHRRVRSAGRFDARLHGRDRRRVRIEAAGGREGLHSDGGATPRAEHVRRRPASADRARSLARTRSTGWTCA